MATIQYLGHSAFNIEHGEMSILIDPFITGNPSSTVSADDFSPNLILLTHAHNDHVGDTIEISKRTGAPVIATFELANALEARGANAVAMNHGGTYRFDGGSAKFVPAWHTSSWTDPDGNVIAPGVPAGFIITLTEGDTSQKLYFAGDTCLFLDMQLIGDEELDLAVLPIGDHFTMGPDDAVRAVKFLRPRYVIPCHYNTFPPIEQDAEAFKAEVEKQTSAQAAILESGQTWELPK